MRSEEFHAKGKWNQSTCNVVDWVIMVGCQWRWHDKLVVHFVELIKVFMANAME
jgi:hypothetical protein